MKNVKIKMLLFGLLLLVVFTGVNGQEDKSYEYASVTYAFKTSLKQAVISVSIEGKYSETIANIKEGNVSVNLEPVIETVNKLSNEGWVVYSNSVVSGAAGGDIVYYFLRRKK